MRMMLAVPLLALAACQVTDDNKNDQLTVQYNQDVAENAVADIANGAEEAGGAIANSAKDASQAVRNIDVDVDLNKADSNKTVNAN
jgi:hypothetical protein